MARNQIDGVIDAVSYQPDGSIRFVRLYEHRGPIWSDILLLTREDLVKRVTGGGKYVTGRRKSYLGGIFEYGPGLNYEKGWFNSGSHQGKKDVLDGVPVF
jgi:hypothetical protein